jgi:hypothetical protein
LRGDVVVFEMAHIMSAFDFELPTDLLGAVECSVGSRADACVVEDSCRHFTALLGDIAAFPTLDSDLQMDEDRLGHLLGIYEDAKTRCGRLEDSQIQQLRRTSAEEAEDESEEFMELLKEMLGIPDLASDVLGPTEVLEDLCREAAFLDFVMGKN